MKDWNLPLTATLKRDESTNRPCLTSELSENAWKILREVPPAQLHRALEMILNEADKVGITRVVMQRCEAREVDRIEDEQRKLAVSIISSSHGI